MTHVMGLIATAGVNISRPVSLCYSSFDNCAVQSENVQREQSFSLILVRVRVRVRRVLKASIHSVMHAYR